MFCVEELKKHDVSDRVEKKIVHKYPKSFLLGLSYTTHLIDLSLSVSLSLSLFLSLSPYLCVCVCVCLNMCRGE
jgi:hypothetical protein